MHTSIHAHTHPVRPSEMSMNDFFTTYAVTRKWILYHYERMCTVVCAKPVLDMILRGKSAGEVYTAA